ncbi:hypothetical protein PHMEG_0003154 [Phytophthora megakarya]|uniref:Reverse transcriptase n=1 Tax=Phytophthora megakarya TaxID=4795 RepID=A0A225WYQ6_9STRA|nr:hypothetical protein PHMEG_0003154 [Phytophthora megakarya]
MGISDRDRTQDELGGHQDKALWFMSLDMASGFWAIRMTERAKLGFRLSVMTLPMDSNAGWPEKCTPDQPASN